LAQEERRLISESRKAALAETKYVEENPWRKWKEFGRKESHGG